MPGRVGRQHPGDQRLEVRRPRHRAERGEAARCVRGSTGAFTPGTLARAVRPATTASGSTAARHSSPRWRAAACPCARSSRLSSRAEVDAAGVEPRHRVDLAAVHDARGGAPRSAGAARSTARGCRPRRSARRRETRSPARTKYAVHVPVDGDVAVVAEDVDGVGRSRSPCRRAAPRRSGARRSASRSGRRCPRRRAGPPAPAEAAGHPARRRLDVGPATTTAPPLDPPHGRRRSSALRAAAAAAAASAAARSAAARCGGLLGRLLLLPLPGRRRGRPAARSSWICAA